MELREGDGACVDVKKGAVLEVENVGDRAAELESLIWSDL